MRLLCQRTVACFDEWWGIAGWILFLSLLVTGYWGRASVPPPVLLSMITLTLAWWIIDAVAQMVPVWMFVVGAAMLVVGTLPGVPSLPTVLLPIACWALYWTKVRE